MSFTSTIGIVHFQRLDAAGLSPHAEAEAEPFLNSVFSVGHFDPFNPLEGASFKSGGSLRGCSLIDQPKSMPIRARFFRTSHSFGFPLGGLEWR